MNKRPEKLLDEVREAIRVRHYSVRTEIYTHVLNRGGLAVRSPSSNPNPRLMYILVSSSSCFRFGPQCLRR